MKKIPSGGLGGFFLQSQMLALVAAVLLGMAGLDALDTDPESEPLLWIPPSPPDRGSFNPTRTPDSVLRFQGGIKTRQSSRGAKVPHLRSSRFADEFLPEMDLRV